MHILIVLLSMQEYMLCNARQNSCFLHQFFYTAYWVSSPAATTSLLPLEIM